MVMATTFLGWKGTVSSHVHRFHRANVYLYTEIWRDAHGMCLQWVCGCIWNVYSFKCIVGFSLCVFYARNVTSVCFFSCQWVGWTVVLPSACLHVRVCVCASVYMFTVSECVPHVVAARSPYTLPLLAADVCQSHSAKSGFQTHLWWKFSHHPSQN